MHHYKKDFKKLSQHLKMKDVDKERGFKEILNSPVFRNFIISEDGNTSGIISLLKKRSNFKTTTR